MNGSRGNKEDRFDPSRFKMPPMTRSDRAIKTKRVVPKSTRIREYHISGLPFRFLNTEFDLPAHAVRMLLAIQATYQLDKRKEGLAVRPGILAQMSMSRMTRSRGYSALEQAGIIKLRRRQGKAPLVDLLY